ncbi:PA14 domain-containing protein [Desertivirga brevis]|uniref:PA14 domain-containing protein n=1 Tax=Desertivirga brevis TaxID=2810310 RepID=UPI001A96C496|nr:PA14 domain-containing protein [Pedobacter sp. SYSU D00873]
MKKLFAAFLLLLPLLCASQTKSVVVPFSFKLSAGATTSAGVYTTDGVLVRTLWSGIKYSQGNYTEKWDGLDDEGRLVTAGKYQIKVLSNNVNYTWEGVIGNTSSQFTGTSVIHTYESLRGAIVKNNFIYCAAGYNEGNTSQFKLPLANPQSKSFILPASHTTSQATLFVTADDTNVYWAGLDPFDFTKWFVFATRQSDDKQVSFSSGVSIKAVNGITYTSAIDTTNTLSGTISGLAVQQRGSFLFVSRKELNRLDVVNKTTGAVVQRISSFIAPQGLAVDGSDNLWVISGTSSVQKFTVNADGTLSAPLLSLSGLVSPLALAVSPDNTIVTVCDGGNSQQVKAFSNSTGTASWTLGQLGGYSTDATVSDTKFYFEDVDKRAFSFIAYQSDGSFWIGDSGNCRMQHYSATRTFLKRVMYLPRTYAIGVDPNNINRVFANYLEFSIDYSKPLAPNNDSWKLVKNWGHSVPKSLNDQYMRLKGVVTLSNGRTYAMQRNASTKFSIIELVSNGTVRITGVETPDLNWRLAKDGSLNKQVYTGGNSVWSKKAFLGFDVSNNPLFDVEKTYGSVASSLLDPVPSGPRRQPGEITSTNILVSFNGSLPSTDGTDFYHLGGVALGENRWKWKTAITTHKNYTGEFPKDGRYDIGNQVQYAGSVAMAMDRNIFWGYNGEFWKNNQTNKWNHVYDNGLFVGQFGTVGVDVKDEEAPAGMAGNCFATAIVKLGDAYYLYHNDESFHSGVHRWKISGLNSISEFVVPVELNLSGRGLLGQYYDEIDLDNVNQRTVRVDSLVNFDWAGGKPGNTNIKSTDNYSVSWTGFVSPLYTESYTFYTKADDGVRLWVDGKLLIDKWTTNNTAIENSSTIALTAGKMYSIRLEYFEKTGNASISLLWSSARQLKGVIPTSVLYPSDPFDFANGIDLMEKLPTNTVLQNEMYGWTRNQVNEDYTSKYAQWWSVKTNVRSSLNQKSPDVTTKFRQTAGAYTLTRNLGVVPCTISGWKITGNINYDGNYENQSGGGAYLDVLDNAGKVLVRFYTKLVNGTTNQVYIYANDKIIAQAASTSIRPTLNSYQPIEITASATGIMVRYASFAPVTTTVFDPLSNWRMPKALQLYFWTSAVGGSNYDRNVSLEGFRYSVESLNDNPTAPVITSNQGSVAATISVAENTVHVTRIMASSSNYLHYSLSGGEDKSWFFIDPQTGHLSFKSLPDYEAPKDMDGNNTYLIKVRVSDGVFYDEQTLTVNVLNVDETSSSMVVLGFPENQTQDNRAKETSIKAVIAYPNPFSNNLNLQFTDHFGETVRLRLVSLLGQILLNTEFHIDNKSYSYSFNEAASLPPGYYIINISGKYIKEQFKVVKY